jgi:hypothetical protein
MFDLSSASCTVEQGAKALLTTPTDEQDVGGLWAEGRVRAVWSGLLSESADGMPSVGKVHVNVAGRKSPPASFVPSALNSNTKKLRSVVTTAPGEWIAAGYSGEGMVHAWLSSKDVALMLLGEDLTEVKTWFPEMFSVTRVMEDRVKTAKRTFKPGIMLGGKRRVFSL